MGPKIEISQGDTPLLPRLPALLTLLIKKYAAKLFPITPIQVGIAEERFHFFAEGEWDGWEYGEVPNTEKMFIEHRLGRSMNGKEIDKWIVTNAGKRIDELINKYYAGWDDIEHPYNPVWKGWRLVDRGAMKELLSRMNAPLALREMNDEQHR